MVWKEGEGAMSNSQWIFTIIIIAIVTYITRAIPFIVFSGKKELNPYIKFLGKVLPYSIMGMLVVYALKDIKFTSGSEYLPELITIGIIYIVHKLRKNNLFSIGIGTITYMLLVQFIFI